MPICAANLSLYSNMLTSLFKKILFCEDPNKAVSLAKKVVNADAFGEIFNILEKERRNQPQMVAESDWMQLARVINQVWINIKNADNDEQAIDEWIALYNRCARNRNPDDIVDLIEAELFGSVLYLQLSDDARNKADSFLKQCQQAFNQKNIVIPGWIYDEHVRAQTADDEKRPAMRMS